MTKTNGKSKKSIPTSALAPEPEPTNVTPKELITKPVEESLDKPKFQLAGIDISEYQSKPLNPNIIVKKEITSVQAKKPNSQQFFRIHPTQEITIDAIHWKDENQLYLVHPSMVPLLQEQTKCITLFVGIYQSGTPFLFPVQQPDGEGRWNSWHESQAEAIKDGRKRWIRMQPNRDNGGYDLHKAGGNLEDPEWPNKSIEEYLTIAFKNHVITDDNHPIVKQLQGRQ